MLNTKVANVVVAVWKKFATNQLIITSMGDIGSQDNMLTVDSPYHHFTVQLGWKLVTKVRRPDSSFLTI